MNLCFNHIRFNKLLRKETFSIDWEIEHTCCVWLGSLKPRYVSLWEFEILQTRELSQIYIVLDLAWRNSGLKWMQLRKLRCKTQRFDTNVRLVWSSGLIFTSPFDHL